MRRPTQTRFCRHVSAALETDTIELSSGKSHTRKRNYLAIRDRLPLDRIRLRLRKRGLKSTEIKQVDVVIVVEVDARTSGFDKFAAPQPEATVTELRARGVRPWSPRETAVWMQSKRVASLERSCMYEIGRFSKMFTNVAWLPVDR